MNTKGLPGLGVMVSKDKDGKTIYCLVVSDGTHDAPLTVFLSFEAANVFIESMKELAKNGARVVEEWDESKIPEGVAGKIGRMEDVKKGAH